MSEGSLRCIQLTDCVAEGGSDSALVLRLSAQHSLPPPARFPLLCAVRAARAAATPQGRLRFAHLRLLSLHALLNALSSEHGAPLLPAPLEFSSILTLFLTTHPHLCPLHRRHARLLSL